MSKFTKVASETPMSSEDDDDAQEPLMSDINENEEISSQNVL